MSGKKSRDKGANGERELAKILREQLGINTIKRNWQGQAAEGGHDLNGIPFLLEVKRHKTATDGQIRKWWEQTIDEAIIDPLSFDIQSIPALAYRADKQEWRFIFPLDEFIDDNFLDRISDDYEWTMNIGLEPFVSICKRLMNHD